MKKGDIVVKILSGGGERTASFGRIKAVKAGVVYLGDGRYPDDVQAYDAKTGMSLNNYISGFSSYIVELDDGEEERLRQETVR